MKNKESKKVVIIQDIKSEAIEQAIFILRSGGQVKPAPIDYRIVTEAQNIIDSYIQTVENTKNELKQGAPKTRQTARKAKKKALLYTGGGLLVLISAIYIVFSLWNGF